MPSSATTKANMFNEDYSVLGEYVSDDSRIPYYNPADSGVDLLPGEPVLVSWQGEERVFMVQDIIRPGELGYLLRRFTGDFPASLSANIVLGDELMWDIDNNVVSLAADVTNGYTIGNAVYPCPLPGETPTVDGNDQVVVGGTASTKVRVQSHVGAPTTKGTVAAL